MAAAVALSPGGRAQPPVRALQLGAAALLLVAWQALAVSGLLFRDVVPSLKLIGAALLHLMADPAFWGNLGISAGEFGLAMAIGGTAGIAVGLALGANRFLGRAYERWLYWLAPTPKIIFFPVLLMLCGAGPSSKVAMGVVSSFFPLAISVAAGVRGIDRVLVRVGIGFGASPLQMVAKIYLPAIRMALLNGLRLAFGITATGVLLAETKLARGGLGFMLNDAYRRFDMPQMYALLILVVLLIAALNAALARLARQQHSGPKHIG
jgi:ABC-type nitrate/sulfonate/bicarbonate transport system permease component